MLAILKLINFSFTGFGIKPRIFKISTISSTLQSRAFLHTPPKLTLPNPPAHHKDAQRQFRRDIGQEYYYTCTTKFSILQARHQTAHFQHLTQIIASNDNFFTTFNFTGKAEALRLYNLLIYFLLRVLS